MNNIYNFILEKLIINKNLKGNTSINKKACAFNDYESVPQYMIDDFWTQKRYAEKLIDKNNIRKEFQDAYNIAKKNVAMLDWAMSPNYTVYFDKDANLIILINHGASWSHQNHLNYYANKCKNYFKLQTAAWMLVDKEKWELLAKGK